MKTMCAGCSGTIMSFFLSFRHKILKSIWLPLTFQYIGSLILYYLTYLRKEKKLFYHFFSIFMFLLFKTSLVI